MVIKTPWLTFVLRCTVFRTVNDWSDGPGVEKVPGCPDFNRRDERAMRREAVAVATGERPDPLLMLSLDRHDLTRKAIQERKEKQ